MTAAEAASPPANTDAARLAVRRILTAAWLAVIAGVGVQLIVIAVRIWAGGAIAAAGFWAEMAQGVSWSVMVCAAIAVGTLASKSRLSLAGIIGFFAGPIAWAAAKGVQKGVQALAGVPQDQMTLLFWSICGVKGLEYAALGAGLAMLVRDGAKYTQYLTLGLLLGLMGACAVIVLNLGNANASGTPLPLPRMMSLLTNEIFFMCACASVIYTAQTLTRSLSQLRPT